MTGLPSCPCGAPAVAFKPGQEPVYAEVGFIVQRGRPTEGTCLACWPAALGYQQELFGHQPTLPAEQPTP